MSQQLTRFINRPKGQTAAQWAALAESVIDSYAKMLSKGRRVTCVYCGHQYPDGTPESQNAALTAHIKDCPKHPLRAARVEADALAGLLREAEVKFEAYRRGEFKSAPIHLMRRMNAALRQFSNRSDPAPQSA